MTGTECQPGDSDSYEKTLNSIGFYHDLYTDPVHFDYVYPTQVGMLRGGWGAGCGCGCGLSGFETWVPIGAHQDTTSTSTIGRLPSGGLIAPAPLSAAWAFHGYLRSARDVPESPHQVRAAGLSSFRTPNAIHGNGSPSLPQNEIFAAWGQWRERGRLNQDLEDAIDALANLIAPPASGTRPAKLEMPGVVVLDLYDTNQSDDQSVTLSVGSYFHDAAAPYALRAPEGPDALVEASLDGGSLTISVPDGSTADGLTAVTVVSKNTDGLPVSWTVLVHVVAVEGYTVQEQAWGETTWHAPEDQGDDWALLWRSNDYRWLAKTTFDGLVTAAYWTFAMMTVDSSRDRWAYDMTKSLGDIPVDPIVTFGGDTLYFQTLNVAHVGLKHADAPSAEQRQIAMTDIKSVEWEEVLYSRVVEIEAHGTSIGLAELEEVGDDDFRVYPSYRRFKEHGIPADGTQPADFKTVRVKVELAAGIPENMEGTLHLGKRLFINWNDSNKNGIPDRKESGPWPKGEKDKDLVPAILDFGLSTYEGLEGYRFYLIADPGLNVWADDRKTPLADAPNPPTGSSGIGDENPRTDDVYWWTIGEDSFGDEPRTVWIEGIKLGEHRVRWQLRHSDGSTVTIVARDTVKFSVEPIVWPSNETGHEWKSEHTSKWNGFELPEGWYIEKSLEELIKPGSEESGIGEIRTGYPVEVPEDSGIWKGQNTVQRAFIDIDKALGLEDGATADSYRVVVHFSYEDGSPEDSQNHYMDIDRPAGHLIKPGFFANSGVFVDSVREIQIFDTASLNTAFDDGTTVTIDGQDTLIKAVMGTPVLDQDDKPIGFTIDPNGSWVTLADAQGQVPDVNVREAEKVSALISGIVYNVDKAYVNNWGSEGGTEVFFNSRADLVAKPGEITIDVYRVGDQKLNIKVTCGETTYYYEGLGGDGNTVELQSHWASGVRFTSATVTAIPPGE